MNYYLRFTLDAMDFAVPIEEVREIARPKSIIKQNGVSKNVLGVFELRSEKVPLFNLPALLKVTARKKFEVIVSECGKIPVGFVVDKVLGVLSIKDLADYPTLCEVDSFFSGIIIHGDDLIQVLSLAKIISGKHLRSLKKALM